MKNYSGDKRLKFMTSRLERIKSERNEIRVNSINLVKRRELDR